MSLNISVNWLKCGLFSWVVSQHANITSHLQYKVGMWDHEQYSSKYQPFGLLGIHAHTRGIHAPHMAGQYWNTAHMYRGHPQSNWTSTGLTYHTIACLELLKQVARGLHFHLAVLGLLQSAVGIQTGCFNYFLVGQVCERQLAVGPDLPQGNGKGPPAQYIHRQGEIQHPGLYYQYIIHILHAQAYWKTITYIV